MLYYYAKDFTRLGRRAALERREATRDTTKRKNNNMREAKCGYGDKATYTYGSIKAKIIRGMNSLYKPGMGLSRFRNELSV